MRLGNYVLASVDTKILDAASRVNWYAQNHADRWQFVEDSAAQVAKYCNIEEPLSTTGKIALCFVHCTTGIDHARFLYDSYLKF